MSKDKTSRSSEADRSLLFGILACQAGLLSERDLVEALREWAEAKQGTLEQFLVARGFLTDSQLSCVRPMFDAYVILHNDEPAHALATLSATPGVVDMVRQQIDDSDVQASLNHLSATMSAAQSAVSRDSNERTDRPDAKRFRVIRPHARGGLGEVYVAKDQELNREVALKEIQPQYADHNDSRSRFVLEAEVTGGLEHPGIVPVYGLGQYSDGRPYYAMRFIKGDSLKDAIQAFHGNEGMSDTDRNLELRKLLKRFVDVCQAIGYAHSRGVLHRDLKPGNIMLGKYGETLVVDWGLAKVAGQRDSSRADDERSLQPTSGSAVAPTMMGSALGTPAYMPPEQASGRLDQLGPASDVYSLGATLYHLLTGAPPFSGHDLATTLRLVQEGEYTRPRLVNAAISQSLEAICVKAMSIGPEDRYASPQDLSDDIECFLADEPVSAFPEPFSIRVRHWARKNQTAVATAIAVLLVSSIATGVVFRQSQQQAIRDKKNSDLLTAQANEMASQATESARIEKENATQQTLLRQKADGARDEAEETLARSNYFLAWARWEADRPREANELLDKIPAEYRHFEWGLAKRQFVGSDFACYGHEGGGIRALRFSQDGSQVISVGKSVRIWNTTTGEEVVRINQASPSWDICSDNRFVAGGDAENVVRVLVTQSGEEVASFPGHTDRIQSVRFNFDGTRVASGGRDHSVRIWDIPTKRELACLLGHKDTVQAVGFSPDGERVASGSSDMTVRLWDIETGELVRIFEGHTNVVLDVSFSPDGTKHASSSWDGTIRLWDTATGMSLRVMQGHTEPFVGTVSFSPDGLYLVSGASDGMVRLWDVASGAELKTYVGHSFPVLAAEFSPDGRRIVSGSGDNTVRFWNVSDGEQQIMLRGHVNGVDTLDYSSDGSLLASGGHDDRVILWDVSSAEPVKTFHGHTDVVKSVSFSPDDRQIASAGRDQTIRLWNVSTGDEVSVLRGHTNTITCVDFSPDGTQVLSGSWDNTVRLWDAATGRELKTFHGHTGYVTGVQFSPDGKQIASGSVDKTVRLWSLATGKLTKTLEGHINVVNCISFSNDGTRIASGSADHTVRIWDASSHEAVTTLPGHTGIVFSLSFNQDDTRIAVGAGGNGIRIWDTTTGEEICLLKEHSGWGMDVAFGPDDSCIASASSDSTIRIWGTSPGQVRKTLRGHGGTLTYVSFSPDGSRLYSESYLGEKLVWDTKAGKTLSDEPWNPPSQPIRVNADDIRAIPSQESILLVDERVKKHPRERAYRAVKAKAQAWWHQERLAYAQSLGDNFATAFHAAWLLKLQPDSRLAYDSLHEAHAGLAADFASRLPLVIKESLKTPKSPIPTLNVDEAKTINERIWRRVFAAGGKPTESEIEQMEAVVRDFPLADYFNTLGITLYRTEQYQTAIDACEKSMELNQVRESGPILNPIDLCVLAMSHFQLGNKEQYGRYRKQLDEVMRDPESTDIKEHEQFYLECDAVAAGKMEWKGLNAFEHQCVFDHYVSHYTPADYRVRVEAGELRFDVAFETDGVRDFVCRNGDQESFDSYNKLYTSQGYTLVQHSECDYQGSSFHAATWKKLAAPHKAERQP